MIDFSTKHGQRALERLQSEIAIWLTTVDDQGVPQPNPVWFLWQDGTLLFYSMPVAKRLRYIVRRPLVAAHFNGDEVGNDVVVLTGEARLDPSTPPAIEVLAYIEKYREGIKDINMTPESFSKEYSVAFRMTPTKLRGF
jgi:PPOX class probable F420-dependent enzyme